MECGTFLREDEFAAMRRVRRLDPEGQGGGNPIWTPPATVISVAESVDFSRQSSQGEIQPLKSAPKFAFLPPDVEGVPLMVQGVQFFAIKQVFRVKAAIRLKNLPGRFRKVIV